MRNVYDVQNNYKGSDFLRFVSKKEAEKNMAEYKAEKRLRYIKAYLRERAARIA